MLTIAGGEDLILRKSILTTYFTSSEPRTCRPRSFITFTQSVRSCPYEFREENSRRYHRYKDGREARIAMESGAIYICITMANSTLAA